jgi:hypothetical protein
MEQVLKPPKNELDELIARAIDRYLKEHGIDTQDGKLIIPRNFLMDSTYSMMWSIRDFDTIISKLVRKMNTGFLNPKDWIGYLKRIYEDQSVVLDKNTTLEPLEIGRKADRVTFEAVRGIWLNMLGNYQKPISHGMIGDGIGVGTYAQQALFHEITRQPINQANNGSLTLRGEMLFITASFPSGVQSFTLREAGTGDSDDAATDKMQFFIQFDGADQKSHTINNDVPQFSTNASICTL